jgi:hypothetical protein
MARISEQFSEFAQYVGVPIQRHLGGDEQFSVVGHGQ